MTEIFTKDQVELAIRASRGNRYSTAQILNCDWATVNNYITRYPELQKAMDETREKMVDVVENALHNQIDLGNITGIIFFLKTQGKDRGYIERSEIEHSGSMKFTEEKRSETIEKIKDSLLNE